jgi:hypothetical protein
MLVTSNSKVHKVFNVGMHVFFVILASLCRIRILSNKLFSKVWLSLENIEELEVAGLL